MALAQAPNDIPVPATPPPPVDEVKLDVPYVSQADFNLLCWAACATMVAQFFQKPATLRSVVESSRVGLVCPDLVVCNFACSEADVLRVYGLLGITGDPPQGPLEQSALQQELVEGRPVEIGIGACGGTDATGHLIIVYGSHVDTTGVTFLVHDPESAGTGTATFQGLLRNGIVALCWRRTWANLHRT
ncbi:MAG TPA: papain-like cysteine protease family protein [Bryobacteraceae bacterium]|nr:papain-like cysteine protease family protein [Bryobacteraceae bacterium]